MNVAGTVTVNVELPDERYAGAWDSIVASEDVKGRLLRWAALSLRLRSSLSYEATGLHGLVVLHGPPGTGKTTLARGLGQKLTEVTAGHRARLIEVSPHGLMSAEHGQSQQKVHELLTEHIPSLAADGTPTLVILDEVESMAVARSEASLSANPADVHRATDAVLTALDDNAASRPHILYVATSNFVGALDDAFFSRADVAIEVPVPSVEGVVAILRGTLSGLAVAFPDLKKLADDVRIHEVGALLHGRDGRQIRKLVTEAMAQRIEVVKDPGRLTIQDLIATAERLPSPSSGGASDATR